MSPEERATVEALIAWAAERWSLDDARRAEQLAECAWAVVGRREYVDGDETNRRADH